MNEYKRPTNPLSEAQIEPSQFTRRDAIKGLSRGFIALPIITLVGCGGEGSANSEAGTEAGTEAGDESSSLSDLGAEPLNRGPAFVGYLSEKFSYSPAIGEGDRELRVALWYPAEEGSGRGLASYPLFTPDQAESEAIPLISAKAPLLVYSHGAKVWPEMGSFMAEYFASHGWVVAAVEHRGDSLTSLSGERPDEIYLWRPLDLSATLNYLESLSSEHPLAGHINTAQALVSGHSFGGYTTFMSAGAKFDLEYLRESHCQERGGTLCESLAGPLGELMRNGARETRFVAAIPQSAGNFDFIRDGVAEVAIPTLMITATRDQSCTEAGSNQPFWEALVAPESILRRSHRRLSFLEAGHATFTVACQHLPTLEQDDGCGADFTPAQEAQQLMLAYSLLFGRAYVLGDEQALTRISNDEDLPVRPEWLEWLSADSR